MKKSVKYLKDLSNHFAFRDYDYTRHHGIKSITYNRDERETTKYRTLRAVRFLLKPPTFLSKLIKEKPLLSRFSLAIHALRKDKNLPDGHLDGGNIITFWEETGEYLQMVQPTIGSLLAKFLIEEPDHPHAQMITKELDRIYKRFNKRIKDGEVF